MNALSEYTAVYSCGEVHAVIPFSSAEINSSLVSLEKVCFVMSNMIMFTDCEHYPVKCAEHKENKEKKREKENFWHVHMYTCIVCKRMH